MTPDFWHPTGRSLGGLWPPAELLSGPLWRAVLGQRLPETARAVETYPSVKDTCTAFAAAGFHQDALEQVRETWPISLADFLGQVDTFRQADTTMRSLSEEEFLRGKERLRRAVRHAEDTANPETRSNWLDLLVLR